MTAALLVLGDIEWKNAITTIDNSCQLLNEADRSANAIIVEIYAKQTAHMSNVLAPLRAVSHHTVNNNITNLWYTHFVAPNPINGCLCEVINSCSCVASHLQEVQDDNSTDGSVYSQSLSIAETPLPSSSAVNSCHTAAITNISTSETPFPLLLDQQQPLNLSTDTVPLIDDADLMNFLENDLDKYLTATSENIPGTY